jgi:hypothetical protein
MTMADILRPQVDENSEERRKAFKKSRGRRRRFTIFVILSFIYGSSGICLATIVPAVLKHGSGITSAVFASADEAAIGSKRAAESGGGYSSYSSGGGSGSSGAAAVPEPSSMILFAIGCAALGGEAARRKLARRVR